MQWIAASPPLTPGDYGSVNITKAITIDGGNKAYIMGAAGGAGIVVKAGASDTVVIRNLAISAPAGTSVTYGINWISGAALYLENVSIFGVSYGVNAVSPGGILVVRNVTIRQSTVAGVYIAPTGASPAMNALLDHVAIDGVSGGGGITINGGRAVVTHSSTTGTKGAGIMAASQAVVDIEDSTFAFANAFGVVAPGGTVRIASSNIHDNTTGLMAYEGGQIFSYGTNRLAGNGTDGSFSGAVALK